MRLPGGLSLPKENLLQSLNSVVWVSTGGGGEKNIGNEETQQLWQQLNLGLNMYVVGW